MKVDISFTQLLPSGSIWNHDDAPTEWLVELTSIKHPDVKDVVVVEARHFNEAVYNGFFTRNIASSWRITEVEEA